MALIIPAIGGTPEAMAIPRLNGRAMRKTMNPDMISAFQCSRRPLKPSLGRVLVVLSACDAPSAFFDCCFATFSRGALCCGARMGIFDSSLGKTDL